MAFSTILHKRSSTQGVVPTSDLLSAGELAINTADGKLFIKSADNQIKTFLNSDLQPYSLNTSNSSVNFQSAPNTSTGLLASVLGGLDNDVSGSGSTVVNGSDNDIAADYAFIGNGSNNTILIGGDYGSILAGQNNTLNHPESFIIGSNITSHLSGFTYVNNLSSTGKIYGDGSELVGIVAGDTEATTLVRQKSADWGTGGTAQSIAFDEISNELSITYGNTISLSSLAGAGGDPEATTLVRSNSANWQTTFQASSAYIPSVPTGISGATQVKNIIKITQAGYNLISVPDPDAIYFII